MSRARLSATAPAVPALDTERGERSRDASAAATDKYYYWLLLAFFVEYARPASFFPFLNIPLIYSFIPLGLYVVSFRAKGLRTHAEVIRDPSIKWVMAYIVFVAVSVLHAEIREFAFEKFKLVLGYGILALMTARIVNTGERLRGLIVTIVLAHLFLIAMNPAILTQPENRNYISGATFLGDGNDFSLSLCIALPWMMVVAMRASSGMKRILGWLSVAVLAFAVVSTQSRGGTVGLAASLLYLWIHSSRKAVSLFAMAAGVGFILLLAPANYFTRMSTLANYEQEDSAMSRIIIWKAGTRMALDNPVFGVGAGNFPEAYGTRYKPEGEYRWKNAHSAYFQIWGELGTTGLITFFAMIFGNLRQNGRLIRLLKPPGKASAAVTATSDDDIWRLRLLSAGTIGFMVAGAFLSAAYYPHIFVVCGVLVAARLTIASGNGVVLHGAKPGAAGARGAAGPAR